MDAKQIDENVGKITIMALWFANLVLMLTLGITLHLTYHQEFPSKNDCSDAVGDRITALFILVWSAFGLRLLLFVQQLAWREVVYTDPCREVLLWTLLLWTFLAEALALGGLGFLRRGDLVRPPVVCHGFTTTSFAQAWSLPFITACIAVCTDIILFMFMRTRTYRLLVEKTPDGQFSSLTQREMTAVSSLPYISMQLTPMTRVE